MDLTRREVTVRNTVQLSTQNSTQPFGEFDK